MPPTFILSDNSLNDKGTRVLTGGIDLNRFLRNPIMFWMHQRDDGFWGSRLPIGRWENIRIEGDQLKADAVFDEKDEFAQTIKNKVEQNIIKSASVGISILETSQQPDHLVSGQIRPTIAKSELIEASIVDIGSNKNALRLYSPDNKELFASEIETKLPKINFMDQSSDKNSSVLIELKAFFAKLFSEKTTNENNSKLQVLEENNIKLASALEQEKQAKIQLESQIQKLSTQIEELKAAPGAESAKAIPTTETSEAENLYSRTVAIMTACGWNFNN